MTYAQALTQLAREHLDVPLELEAKLHRAYGDSLSAFGEELIGDAYDRALQAAEDGHGELYITSLIAALLTGYRRDRAARRGALSDAFYDTYKAGYERGATDQLLAFGETPDFDLKNTAVVSVIAAHAEEMAGPAAVTTDRTLYGQAARGALAGLGSPELDIGYLADLNARTVLARGLNAGALGLVLYSVAGRATKTWRHGPSTPNEKRRPSHAALEGVTIGLTEMFNLGDALVAHPHDWVSAGANQWSMCHCVCVYGLGDNARMTPWRGF